MVKKRVTLVLIIERHNVKSSQRIRAVYARAFATEGPVVTIADGIPFGASGAPRV